MPNLVLTFGEVLAGAVMLDAAVKGDSIANVVKGVATQHPLPGESSSAGANGSTSASSSSTQPTAVDASKIPAGTFASGITAAGLQPRVIAAIVWAKAHGWTGQIISAYRSAAEQAQLYSQLHGTHPVAEPGDSRHQQGLAVDVTNPSGFAAALASAPSSIKLISGASFGDPNHFSTDGH